MCISCVLSMMPPNNMTDTFALHSWKAWLAPSKLLVIFWGRKKSLLIAHAASCPDCILFPDALAFGTG